PVSPRTADGKTYKIRRYRPRIESQFARIERWTNIANPTDVHWRSITKDNILTLYGRDENSRIVDPDPTHAGHIFSWLISEMRDDKGNAILYEYKLEDDRGLNLAQSHEVNRGKKGDIRRNVNRYIKHIYYGNRKTLLEDGKRPAFLSKAAVAGADWMFEV